VTSLAILGGAGHASDVLAIVEAQMLSGECAFDEVTISDDRWRRKDRFLDRPARLVDGLCSCISTGSPFIVGIGYPENRLQIAKRATAAGGVAAPALLHPSSDVASGARLEDGVAVFGQTWVSPGGELDSHVHVLYGSTVGHDTKIGAFSSVMPGARISGDVKIGADVLIGAGAIVLEGIRIGSGAIVGAGSVVTRDVLEGTTVMGVPARRRS